MKRNPARWLPMGALAVMLLVAPAEALNHGGQETRATLGGTTYAEDRKAHPDLRARIDEDGLNRLSRQEREELLGLIERYADSLEKAKYYEIESPSKSLTFSRDADLLREEIESRFGHVLKK